MPSAGPIRPTGPATAYESFVQATYRDFLGRPPVPDELVDWASKLESGQVSVSQYLSGLSTSYEWLYTVVAKFYRDTLQREPEPTGLVGWAEVLRSGKMSVDQVASYFYASDEFYQRFGGGSVSPWVSQLYQKLLGRSPDQGGLENWVRNANRFGRPWVSFSFYQSAESRSRRVQTLYRALLQRDPDPTGWPYWTDGLLMWSDLTLASLLASSQEYWDNSAKRFPMFPGPPLIVKTTMPIGYVGTPYSTTITATEGVPPYTWTPGGLPAGLTMNPSTGVISGTPTESVVNQVVKVYVYDAVGLPGMATYSLTIFGDPVVSTESLRYGVPGRPYSLTLAASAGTSPPVTWSATGLPAGISLDPTTGLLSGTPSALGAYPVTFTLTDSRGGTAEKTLTLPVQANQAVRQVTVGGRHACAGTSTGTVRCWGGNSAGQLGDGTTADSLTPVDVMGLASGVTAISAGDDHTCALTTAGGVKCWGSNSQGQLGDGTRTSRSLPVDVVGLSSGVTAISAGGVVTCALMASGGVKCWGLNSRGAIGDGTTRNSSSPRDVSGMSSGVAAISAGGAHVCALTTGGAVKCWGSNAWGEIGDGTTTHRLAPVDVLGLDNGVIAIEAGRTHSCALKSGGAVSCWGQNNYGMLGATTANVRWPTPVTVEGVPSSATVVEAGDTHSCAIVSGGALTCWGNNEAGQLGDGTTSLSSPPVGVLGLSTGVMAVGTGIGQTCALTSRGGVQCWGTNGVGQLGDGTTASSSTPVDVYGFAMG